MWSSAVPLNLFCSAVPLAMALDAPPGPSPRVCILGFLLCWWCYVMWACTGTLVLLWVSCCVSMCHAFVSILVGCAPGNGSRCTSWSVPEMCVLELWLCWWCYVMWQCTVRLFLFCWTVSLLMALDAPPGPSPRVCVLGTLLCRWCYDVCPSAVLLYLFC